MINRALKLTRQFHRLSQTELARRLEISKSFLSELESGKKSPTIDLLERYSTEFKMPASAFLMFSEQLRSSQRSAFRQKGMDKVLRLLEWVAAGEGNDDAAA